MKHKMYKIKNSTNVLPNLNKTMPVGWICPLCGRALSPWTSCCPCRTPQPVTCPDSEPIVNPSITWNTTTAGRPQHKTITSYLTTYPPTEGQPIKQEYDEPSIEGIFIGDIK